MRLLPFNSSDSVSSAQDHAKGGYALGELEKLLRDVDAQPEWRLRADLAHAYYDFKQLSPEQQRRIKMDMGIDPRQTNLIHGVINGVLGQEAKARSDVRVEADGDELEDVCEVLSAAMKEAQRETFADMAISEGYAGQVKGGISWVEVSRATDPLDYPYRIEARHRNEIWYDWRATDLGLRTARWMLRKRWMDLDEAVALLPQFKSILDSAINGWDIVNLPDDVNNFMYRSYNLERRTSIRRDEWCDTSRRRIKFFEVWYRVPAEVVVMQVSPTRRVIYDEKNPLHVAAVARGRVRIMKAVTRQVRMALFAGPHRLIDVGTRRRNFPYIPFFAFRDDEDRTPYGLIEGMISPQDEYNERRQYINWMLKARQIRIDSDALDTEYNSISEIVDTVGRPDMVAVLNPTRKNANGLQIGNDLTLQKEQLEVMQDAKQLIQDVPRVYSTQLGKAPAGVTSGIAINSLTEAGAMAMGELNDNYRYSRRMVFEQLLDLIVEDHLEADMRVLVGSGDNRRVVILNTFDPQTQQPVNQVKDAPVKVGLSDVPSSPAFRLQEQQQLGGIITALAQNPSAVAVLSPAFIEGSSHPDRKELADQLRRATGQPTSGDRQAQAAQGQQAQQQQQFQQQVQNAAAVATVQKTKADTTRTLALAEREKAQADQILQGTQSAGVPAMPEQPAANDEDTVINNALREAAV